MDLRIKTPEKRVRAYYDRDFSNGGIALSVYDETMKGRCVCTMGYDEHRKKMVLLVNPDNAALEDVDVVCMKNSEAGEWITDEGRPPVVDYNIYPRPLYKCPECGCNVDFSAVCRCKFCLQCGQKIDWTGFPPEKDENDPCYDWRLKDLWRHEKLAKA